MEQKFVRVLRLNIVLGKIVEREVFQVEGYNCTCVTVNRGRKNMTVIFVWKPQTSDKVLVTLHETIGNGLIHKSPGPCQFGRVKIMAVGEKVANPLVMNLLCPFGTKKPHRGSLHKKIAQWGRI